MKIFLVLALSSFLSFASNKGGYDVVLVHSVEQILESINEQKTEYCNAISAKKIETSLYTNCSTEEVKKIIDRQLKAYAMIESWLIQIREYEKLNLLSKEKYTAKRLGGKVKIKKERSILTNLTKTLQCVSNKINYIGFQCRSQHSLCSGANAATEIFGPITDIYLCSNFWQGEQAEIGTIIHEIAHHCGAVDATYFNYISRAPRTFEGVHWSRIADTYEYWAEFGFCIPGIDCATGGSGSGSN